MLGFITEMHFEQAEAEFPGIRAVYAACPVKPGTFTELLARYLRGPGELRASDLPTRSAGRTAWWRPCTPVPS